MLREKCFSFQPWHTHPGPGFASVLCPLGGLSGRAGNLKFPPQNRFVGGEKIVADDRARCHFPSRGCCRAFRLPAIFLESSQRGGGGSPPSPTPLCPPGTNSRARSGRAKLLQEVLFDQSGELLPDHLRGGDAG